MKKFFKILLWVIVGIVSINIIIFLVFFISAIFSVERPNTVDEILSSKYYDWYSWNDYRFEYNGKLYQSCDFESSLIDGQKNDDFVRIEFNGKMTVFRLYVEDNTVDGKKRVVDENEYFLLKSTVSDTLLVIPFDSLENHTTFARPFAFCINPVR